MTDKYFIYALINEANEDLLTAVEGQSVSEAVEMTGSRRRPGQAWYVLETGDIEHWVPSLRSRWTERQVQEWRSAVRIGQPAGPFRI